MTPQDFECMKGLVRAILERPSCFEWSVQGFGMLRTYPDAAKRFRLNIWDSKLAVPDVSTVHDHPWHFDSWVIAGKFRNVRYHIVDGPTLQTEPFMRWRIQTGEGGGPVEEPVPVHLYRHETEHYIAGDSYRQAATEIHHSEYFDGTVTINDRRRLPDGEHAYVFWPMGQKWVDAEPRAATWPEVTRTIERAIPWFT